MLVPEMQRSTSYHIIIVVLSTHFSVIRRNKTHMDHKENKILFCSVFVYVKKFLSVVFTTALHAHSTLIRSLHWRHNERDSVTNHQRIECLPNRLFRRRSTKSPKLRVTDPCEGNPPVTGGFPSQRASNAENVSIWWRHHVQLGLY